MMPERTSVEEYKDIIPHEWVTKYRLPVISSYHPDYNYFLTVGYPQNGVHNDIFDVSPPTEEEAVILASYMEFLFSNPGFPPAVKERMERQPLYTKAEQNTISFVKRANNTWGYSRLSWRNKFPVPHWNEDVQYHNVLDLIDHIEGSYEKWKTWKRENGLMS